MLGLPRMNGDPDSLDPWEMEDRYGIPAEARVVTPVRAPSPLPTLPHPGPLGGESPPDLYVFLDDCTLGDKDKPGHFVGRGGFGVPRAELQSLGREFHEIVQNAGAPTYDPRVDTEVCWNPASGSFFGELEKREDVYAQLLALLRTHQCASFAAVVSLGSLTKARWDRNMARSEALKYVTERVEFYLRHHGQAGHMFIDDELAPAGNVHPKLQVETLLAAGTEYKFTFNQLSREVSILDSHNHLGIQLADLVVGTTTRRVADFVQKASNLAPLNPTSVASTQLLWAGLQGGFAYELEGESASTPQVYGLSLLPSSYAIPFVNEAHPYPAA
jgi:hypothetical protein